MDEASSADTETMKGEGPRARGSGTESVYKALRHEILTMERPPGSPLDETRLSEHFGMSRTPIREALLRLTSEGLVTSLPNRNTIVATIDFVRLPVYFEALHNCLNPGAAATLQIITVPDHRFEAYRKTVDFIQKYIFPGGMLPSPAVLHREVERAGLRLAGSIEFGLSYSQTLRRWHDTFNAKWNDVAKMGFDDRFRRMWNFYLTSCAGAFEGGNCDVTQITVTRPN